MPKVSAVMIVRDEERYLQECLESICGQVDEIIIVDTGSVDATKSIAQKFTSLVYDYSWCGDFSAARNYGLSKATGEWILAIDADERLEPEALKPSLKNCAGQYDALALPVCCLSWQKISDQLFPVIRLFRNSPEFRYIGFIHEQVALEERHRVGVLEHPVIYHCPVPAKERNKRRRRNIELLKKRYRQEPSPYLEYYLGIEWLGLGRYETAITYLAKACSNLDNPVFKGSAVRSYIQALKGMGRLEEALIFCMEQAEIHPDFTDLYYEAGLLLEELKEYEPASRWFSHAVSRKTCLKYTSTIGVDSFLSYWHLGYCRQMLNDDSKAQYFYELAFNSQPTFVLPLYSLCLLMLNNAGAGDVLEYFERQGFLQSVLAAAALAEAFWQGGMASYAACCLKAVIERGGKLDGESVFWLSFSDLKTARQCYQQLAEQDRQRHRDCEALISILGEDYRTAKRQALALWADQSWRSRGWALLNLTSMLAGGKICGKPEPYRRAEMVDYLVNLLRQLDKSFGFPNLQHKTVYEAVVTVLSRFEEGCQKLAAYYDEKSKEFSRRFVRIFTAEAGQCWT